MQRNIQINKIGNWIILIFYSLFLFSCSNSKKQGDTNNRIDFQVTYYPDSSIKVIAQRKNGLLEGKSFQFTEYGAKLWEFNFVSEKQEGIQYFYSEGRLNFEVSYKNGIRHGWAKRYTGTCGSLSEEGQYENDKKNGLWYKYFDRELLGVDLYEEDSLVKRIYRDKKYPITELPPSSSVKDCGGQWNP